MIFNYKYANLWYFTFYLRSFRASAQISSYKKWLLSFYSTPGCFSKPKDRQLGNKLHFIVISIYLSASCFVFEWMVWLLPQGSLLNLHYRHCFIKSYLFGKQIPINVKQESPSNYESINGKQSFLQSERIENTVFQIIDLLFLKTIIWKIEGRNKHFFFSERRRKRIPLSLCTV